MHILLEEAPLLVYYFLTLFLSNYKLRLILSIFWTTSTFCQLELPCSLRSLRSLGRSLAHFVRCARWDAHLLTSFAVLAGGGGGGGGSAPYGRSWRSLTLALLHSLRSRNRAHFVSRLALANARAESSLRSLYNKRSLRSHLLYSLVPSISIATSSLHLASLVTTLRRVPPV